MGEPEIEEDVVDLSDCPYYRNQAGLPKFLSGEGGYGLATCGYGCIDEPECITGGGWPGDEKLNKEVETFKHDFEAEGPLVA